MATPKYQLDDTTFGVTKIVLADEVDVQIVSTSFFAIALRVVLRNKASLHFSRNCRFATMQIECADTAIVDGRSICVRTLQVNATDASQVRGILVEESGCIDASDISNVSVTANDPAQITCNKEDLATIRVNAVGRSWRETFVEAMTDFVVEMDDERKKQKKRKSEGNKN